MAGEDLDKYGSMSEKDQAMMKMGDQGDMGSTETKEGKTEATLKFKEVGNGKITIGGPELENAIMSFETHDGQIILKGDIVTFAREMPDGTQAEYTGIIYNLKYDEANGEAKGDIISARADQDTVVPGWIRLQDAKRNISHTMRSKEEGSKI